MGVTGLWDLVSPVGHRVSNEHVRNKVLAVDVSIWLTQFVKAMRDAEGAKMRNGHLLGVLRRCLKLLFLAVKPVMIFDGEQPLIKRRTLARRNAAREQHAAKLRRLAEKLLLNRLKQSALKHVIPPHIAKSTASKFTQKTKPSSIIDDFDKPISVSDDDADPIDDDAENEPIHLPNDLDVLDDQTLLELPSKVQAKVVKQMKLQYRTKHREEMMQHQSDPTAFSNTQIEGFLQRIVLNKRINRVRNTINKNTGAENRIASDNNREYIFEEYPLLSSFGSAAVRKNGASVFDDEDNRDIDFDDDDDLLNKKKSDTPSVDILARIRAEKEAENPRRARLPLKSAQDRQKRDNRSGVGWASKVLGDHGGLRLTGNHLVNDINKRDGDDDLSESDEDQWEDGNSDDRKGDEEQEKTCNVNSSAGNDNDDDEGNDIEWIDGADDEHGQLHEHLMSDQMIRVQREGRQHMDQNDFKRLARAIKEKADEADAVHKKQQEMMKARCKESPTVKIHFDSPTLTCKGNERYPEIAIATFNERRNDSTSPDLIGDRDDVKDEGQRVDLKHKTSNDAKGPLETSFDNQLDTDMCSSRTQLDNDASKGFVLDADGGLDEITPVVKTTDSSQEKAQKPSQNRGNISAERITQEEDMPLNEEDNRSISVIKPLDTTGSSSERTSRPLPKNSINNTIPMNLTTVKIGTSDEERVEERNMDFDPLSNDQKNGEMNNLQKRVGALENDNGEGVEGNLAGDELESDIQLAIARSLEEKQKDEKIAEDPSSRAEAVNNTSESTGVNEDPELDEITPVQKPALKLPSEQRGADIGNDGWGAQDEEALLISESEALLNNNSDVDAADGQRSRRPMSPRNVERLRKELEVEEEEIRRLKSSHQAGAERVSDEMYAETRDLLKLLGIPYLQAPSEAEAQCAFLDMNKLVDGIISEDSDSFLFGAQTVYRKLFISGQFAEAYEASDIAQKLGLGRESLIRLAYLLGSDYTNGVRGVGVVNSMEIMEAFKGENGLNEFREWMEKIDLLDQPPPNDLMNSKNTSPGAVRARFCWKHRNMKRNWTIRDNRFPNEAVAEAYWQPQIDTNLARFKWGRVDFDGLAKFCWEKFAWPIEKFNSYVGPVRQELQTRGGPRQRRIDEFFKPHRFAKIRSERLQDAVLGMVGEDAEDLMDPIVPKNRNAKGKKSSQAVPNDDVGFNDDARIEDDNLTEEELMVRMLEDVERSRSMNSAPQEVKPLRRSTRKRSRR